MAGFVEFDELALQHGIPGSSTVLQVIHLPFPQRIFREQFYYAKRNAAHRHNVHASVVIALHDFQDLCRAADFRHALWQRQEHAEFRFFLQANLHHFFIARLENVQGQGSPG